MTEERRAAIVRLLQSRDDHLPAPESKDWVGATRPSPKPRSGFAHDVVHELACEDCLANGEPVKGCETCGGSGVIEVRLKRDPYAKSDVVGVDVLRHEATRERDATIARLEQQTRTPRSEAELLEEANRRGYGWEEARREMYARFDYPALDRALDELRDTDESAYHALHAVYVYAWMTELSPAAELAVERGLQLLSERLPEELRAPGSPGHPAAERQRGRGERAA